MIRQRVSEVTARQPTVRHHLSAQAKTITLRVTDGAGVELSPRRARERLPSPQIRPHGYCATRCSRHVRRKMGVMVAPMEPKLTPLQQRMQDEAQGGDPQAMERFKLEHAGLTPIQWALACFPSAARQVGNAFPHLLPPHMHR